MRERIKRFVNKHGNLFCIVATLVVPVVSQGCFCKFYQPEEPENLKMDKGDQL